VKDAAEIPFGDRLVTRKALAEWLHVSPLQLGRWGKKHYGPVPRRVGGYKIVYRVADVLEFIEQAGAAAHPDVRRVKNTLGSQKPKRAR
jgi:hypothetical protein